MLRQTSTPLKLSEKCLCNLYPHTYFKFIPFPLTPQVVQIPVQ